MGASTRIQGMTAASIAALLLRNLVFTKKKGLVRTIAVDAAGRDMLVAALEGTKVDQAVAQDLIQLAECVRHYLHQQVGKPAKPELASATEIALDNLIDAIRGQTKLPKLPTTKAA